MSPMSSTEKVGGQKMQQAGGNPITQMLGLDTKSTGGRRRRRTSKGSRRKRSSKKSRRRR